MLAVRWLHVLGMALGIGGIVGVLFAALDAALFRAATRIAPVADA